MVEKSRQAVTKLLALRGIKSPKTYDPVTFGSNNREVTFYYSQNFILVEPCDYQETRNVFSKHKMQYLLRGGENKEYCNGFLRFGLLDLSDIELGTIRNLDVTTPTSKLTNPEDNIFESYENRNQHPVVEEHKCRLPESVKKKIDSLKRRKRHWRRLLSGDFKPKNKK